MDLLPFLAVTVLVVIVPGVDMAVVTQQVLARSRRAGLVTVAGVVTGSAVQAGAATLGLSALLAASQPAFTAVRVLGAAYLVWLGITTLWQARGGDGDTPAPRGIRSGFRVGLLTNLLNPKIIVFYVALLPQFVTPGPGAAARTAVLAAVFLGVATAWLVGYVALVGRLRAVLSRPAVRRRIERVTGVVLVGLGARLALDAT